MDIFLAQLLNALLYAAVLFLIAGGLSLIFGATPMTASPLWAAFGTLHLMGATYPRYNVVVILLGVLTAVLLWAFVFKTRFGVMLRATSQNRRMAAALGINVGGVYVQAFALGCLMAGLAGAVIVPIQGAVLGMGVDALVLAFVVVVIGGLGSLDGALVGALIVGVVRTVAIQYFPELELAVLYLIAAVVLITRPAGLLGRA